MAVPAARAIVPIVPIAPHLNKRNFPTLDTSANSMGIENFILERVIPSKATFGVAREMAELALEAFQQDSMFAIHQGPDFTFTHPISAAQRPRYNKLLTQMAWQHWQTLSDVNKRCFILRERKSKRLVGLSLWDLPKQLHRQLTVSELVSSLYIKARIWLYNMYLRLTEKNPPLPTKAVKEYDAWVNKEFYGSPEYAKSLAHKTYKELTEFSYPKGTTTACKLMAVRQGYSGQGLGYGFFGEVMARLPLSTVEFTDGAVSSVGPAKFSLMSSPVGRGLYHKLGFHLVKENEEVVTGIKVPNCFMECLGTHGHHRKIKTKAPSEQASASTST